MTELHKKVVDAINANFDVVKFLIFSSICAANSRRAEHIFKPRPDTTESVIGIKPADVPTLIRDIVDMKEISEDILKFIDSILTIGSKYDMSYQKLSVKDTNSKTHKISEFKVVADPVERIKFEAKQTTRDSFYLFHGSGIENWYSIVANGIKNCSNTNLMICGAAYGSGVYLSNRLATSYSYGCSKEFATGGKFCIGVFEVLGKSSDYAKGGTIFVVEDPKELFLRYILIIDRSAVSVLDKLSTDLFERFVAKVSQRRIDKVNAIDKRARRLAKEMAKCTAAGYVIEQSNPDSKYNCIIWTVYYVNNTGTVQILFTPDYPFETVIYWDRLGCHKYKNWVPSTRILNKLNDSMLPTKTLVGKEPDEFFETLPKVNIGYF